MLTLVVMAAGMGSRFGGLKQMTPVSQDGSVILDFSVFDAIRAGFTKVVFVIRKDFEELFKEKIGAKLAGKIEVEYVFQDLHDIPSPFSVPEGRTKPWGTGHAVLTAKPAVTGPFAVINADDFYGQDALARLGEFLRSTETRSVDNEFCIVGYPLKNTLSDYGSVSRGVCKVDAEGTLLEINERLKIYRNESGVVYEDDSGIHPLTGDENASMNCFGFGVSLMNELETGFVEFLQSRSTEEKSEYLLPVKVGDMMNKKTATIKVVPTTGEWFGITNPADLPIVQDKIQRLIDAGEYPSQLF